MREEHNFVTRLLASNKANFQHNNLRKKQNLHNSGFGWAKHFKIRLRK